MRRASMFALSLAAAALCAVGAEAAIKKYQINTINITETPDTSPGPVLLTGADAPPEPPHDIAFVDDGVPGAPVLKKFRFKSLGSDTILVPGLNQSGARIFLNNNFLEGPGGPSVKPKTFTGTGHTAAGSTISWGIVTGWSVTGATFCSANPPIICSFATQKPDTTNDPAFHSDFYDMGTWTFHTTGFTATPFVHQYFTAPPGNFGNNQRWIRGVSIVDFSVPALPLVGVLLLGGSVVVGGFIALGRGRRE